ncbi:twin-arginine translocation pathway signal [Mycobacterium sp. TNTM28]|uniref:Twin-arginine translocation pathway signal n=1 Tax=[Mycobacterium] fortunisiensis TaxID=2600579 RepID=A0ABS6KH14_9MYCO|nr:twin-arginine translocation pathway signal [[Mycobacterium] fortunisiensis]MBU9762853.1 twin-arginine translocation pathway signal [[Mycobacterium] fortunisiensis]
MSTTIAAAEIDNESDTEETVGVEAEPDLAEQRSEASLRWPGRIARRWRLIAVTGLLLASAGSLAALYFGVYRVDHGAVAASTAVVEAASEGSTAILSYAPDSLDQDFATARSRLTGEFLTYYSQFADQFVAPAAKQKDIEATASVVRAAPIRVQSDSAEVLVYLNQATTSRDNPQPAQAASAVKVGLTKVDGKWLISSFDPV